jgi:DNA-binding transcriptional MerR regulator
MLIGELAQRAGVSTRTLRYYEQQGLISARRAANGYRQYEESDLRLVAEIRSLLAAGFTLGGHPAVRGLPAGGS